MSVGYAPAWSPNGERIAYVTGGDLWVADADGTHQARRGRRPADVLAERQAAGVGARRPHLRRGATRRPRCAARLAPHSARARAAARPRPARAHRPHDPETSRSLAARLHVARLERRPRTRVHRG